MINIKLTGKVELLSKFCVIGLLNSCKLKLDNLEIKEQVKPNTLNDKNFLKEVVDAAEERLLDYHSSEWTNEILDDTIKTFIGAYDDLTNIDKNELFELTFDLEDEVVKALF